MKTITVKISPETAALIGRYIMGARHLDGSCLTIESLVELLLDDVALVVRRPGCWEACVMSSLLTAHGYQ